ncbi:VWA domain-containing protein [Planctomycetota bacterium]|nr:VWA domain-containing protein [Planctomycetota bacterium]
MEFTVPWLVIAAAVLGVGSVGVWLRRKQATPVLLCVAGALFLFSGAGPMVGSSGITTHVLIVDASDSMASTFDLAVKAAELAVENAPDESEIRVRYFNDSFHDTEIAPAGRTLIEAIPSAEDLEINGDVVVLTDGHIQSDNLPPPRTILAKSPNSVQPDASILEFAAPTVAPVGASILLTATVRCDASANVPWVISGPKGEVATGVIGLDASLPEEIRATVSLGGAGVQRFRLTLNLSSDRESRNNVAEVAVTVAGKRMIYYAAHRDSSPDSDALLSMLRTDATNGIIQQLTLPMTRTELDGIHLLVINNVAASGSSPAQLKMIANWVRDGGALFMVGTDKAFGPGGYRDTPIEEVLPVRLMPDDEPARTVLFALDTSSSMAEGGKLAVLKQAGLNLLDSLSPRDQVGVSGFSGGFRTDITYSSAEAQRANIERLSASGSTDIGKTITQALDSLLVAQADAQPQRRLILVTDGRDEAEASTDFSALALRCAAENTRLDVVLTSQEVPDWLLVMQREPQFVKVWEAATDEFGGLLETLDRALRGFEHRLISTTPMKVPGVVEDLMRFVRTAPRTEAGDITTLLRAETPPTGKPNYPLLAYRKIVGTTAVLTTDSSGKQATFNLWRDAGFRQQLQVTLQELLAGASSPQLELRTINGQWQLEWVGLSDPPTQALTVKDQMTCELTSPGVWALPKAPTGESILVYSGESLLQRIPISKPIDTELAYTGNDEAYFTAAEQAGFVVFNNLSAWQPKAATFGEKMNLSWVPALLAMISLLTGFALRSRK